MKKELHLFIIWHNARNKEEEILNDISSKFDIVQVFDVKWSKKLFSKNLSRLYGKKLSKASKKTRQVGEDEFLLVVINDNNPAHISDKNLNVLIAKNEYRELTGGGHLVHASDHPEETEENLLLILGLTSKEFEQKYQAPWDGNIIKFNQDPIATKGWKNEDLLISFINKIDNCKLKRNNNIKIIETDNKSKLCRLINASPSLLSFINLYKIPINGNNQLLKIK